MCSVGCPLHGEGHLFSSFEELEWRRWLITVILRLPRKKAEIDVLSPKPHPLLEAGIG